MSRSGALDRGVREANTRPQRAGERAKNGINVSLWDAPNVFQTAQERAICEELARSLRQKGSADVGRIGSNCNTNGFPDCNAKNGWQANRHRSDRVD